MRRANEIAAKLHRPRRIEAEFLAQFGAFGLRNRLPHELPKRIAEVRPHGKGDDEDRQHDEKSLAEAPHNESKAGKRCVHFSGSLLPLAASPGPREAEADGPRHQRLPRDKNHRRHEKCRSGI